MENQSLIPSPNDNGGKQKKGYKSVQIVSTAILLLGLVFYGGEYWGRYRALGDGPTDAHLRHGEMGMTNAAAASSSSMSLVGSGTAASNLKTLTIALDDDEVIEGLLSGWLPPGGGNVGGDVIPIDGPNCYEAPEDCAIPPGMTHPNCVCPFVNPKACYCLSGQPDALCVEPSDCVIPLGLEHPVCLFPRHGHYTCQSGQPGALCDQTSDCVAPPGLNHPVCRSDGSNKRCQSGQPGSLCGVTEDCVVPLGLDHAVCRKDRCQQGVKGDYCGQNSDCISNNCVGKTGIAKCHN